MLIPLLGVIVLALAWSLYWFFALSYAKSRIAAEREALTARGYELVCAEEHWGGFPFRFEFTCTAPVAHLPSGETARSGNLLAVALAYKPWHLIALLDGPTTFERPGVQPIALEHGRIATSLRFDRNAVPTLSAEIPRPKISDMLSAAQVLVHARPRPDGNIDLALTVDDFNWITPTQERLAIAAAQAQGVLSAEPVMRFEKIDLRQGNVHYWGSGTVGLDAERRISGKLSTETNDLNGLLNIIEPHLLMPNDQKRNIRMVLGLLGQNAKADIVATGGELYIGPFKIADLLPLD